MLKKYEDLRMMKQVRISGSHGGEYEDGCLLRCVVIANRPDDGGSKGL
jgi:hypothetical protein